MAASRALNCADGAWIDQPLILDWSSYRMAEAGWYDAGDVKPGSSPRTRGTPGALLRVRRPLDELGS